MCLAERIPTSPTRIPVPAPSQIKCPTCKRAGDWFAGPFGPFCSRRCKLVDLGKWLGEENRISEPLRPEHFQGYEKLPPGEHLDQPEDQDRH